MNNEKDEIQLISKLLDGVKAIVDCKEYHLDYVLMSKALLSPEEIEVVDLACTDLINAYSKMTGVLKNHLK